EDKAAYPIQALIMMAGAVACLVRPALGGGAAVAGRRRGYASVILVGLVLHTVTVKWQPWGNRLFLYLVVLAAPLAGLMLAAVFDRAGALARPGPARQAGRVRRPLLAGLLVLALPVGGVAGGASAAFRPPRPRVRGPPRRVLC